MTNECRYQKVNSEKNVRYFVFISFEAFVKSKANIKINYSFDTINDESLYKFHIRLFGDICLTLFTLGTIVGTTQLKLSSKQNYKLLSSRTILIKSKFLTLGN